MTHTKLWNRDFTILWIGLLQSYLGDAFLSIGVMWLVLELTGSAVAASTIIILQNMPKVFGPVAGVVVDRTDKRALLIVSDWVRGVILVLLFFLYMLGELMAWHVYVMIAFLGMFAILYGPALQVALPKLVPDRSLTQANSLVQGGQQLAMVVGASLAGVTLVAFGAYVALLVDGLSYLLCGLLLFVVHLPKETAGATRVSIKEILGDLKDGLFYLGYTKEVLLLTVVAFAINCVVGPVNVVFPIFAKDVLGEGIQAFGFLASAIAFGLLVGNGVVGGVGDRLSFVQSIAIGLLATSITLAMLGLSRSLIPALVAAGVLGMSVPFIQVALVSRLQRNVPGEYQGRVFATLGSVVALAFPVSAAVTGQLLQVLPANTFFYISAVGILVVASIWIRYGIQPHFAARYR